MTFKPCTAYSSIDKLDVINQSLIIFQYSFKSTKYKMKWLMIRSSVAVSERTLRRSVCVFGKSIFNHTICVWTMARTTYMRYAVFYITAKGVKLYCIENFFIKNAIEHRIRWRNTDFEFRHHDSMKIISSQQQTADRNTHFCVQNAIERRKRWRITDS